VLIPGAINPHQYT